MFFLRFYVFYSSHENFFNTIELDDKYSALENGDNCVVFTGLMSSYFSYNQIKIFPIYPGDMSRSSHEIKKKTKLDYVDHNYIRIS